MNPGDKIRVHMHDTAAGFRVDLRDLTTGGSGSMTASIANGFGQILYRPNAKTCSMKPYAFHPAYDTAVSRGTTWGAHTYNVAYSDEIGHFEFCNKLDANFNCKRPGANDPGGLDSDDVGCVPGRRLEPHRRHGVLRIRRRLRRTVLPQRLAGHGPERGEGSEVPSQFRAVHESVERGTGLRACRVRGGSAPHRGRRPRRPGPFCDRMTGAHCVNPPPGSQFYPFFSTRMVGGTCTWQEGGAYIPGTVRDFGGNSRRAFGSLLGVVYPEAGFTTATLINDFQRVLDNPCRRGGQR